MPLWIALENGYFADEGLAVETTMFGNASQIPPLLDGSMQVVLGSPELAVQNAADGGPLRLIGGNTGKLVHSLIARAPFKRIEDLRGATIGILSLKEGTFFHIQTMLAAHGLHYPADYKTRDTGGVPPRHKALMEGTIDAGLQSVPWNFVAEDEGMNHLGNVVDYVPDWQFVSINANRDRVAKNRDATVRFLRAMLQGDRLLLRQPRRLRGDRGARAAGAARPRGARLGSLHRHRCDDAQHGGQHQGPRDRDRHAGENRPPAGRRALAIPRSTSTTARWRRRVAADRAPRRFTSQLRDRGAAMWPRRGGPAKLAGPSGRHRGTNLLLLSPSSRRASPFVNQNSSPDTFRIPSLIKRNTVLFALSQSFTGAGMQLAYGIGPLMVIALTGSAALAGLFVGLIGLSRFLVSYPIGRIMDIYGRKPGILSRPRAGAVRFGDHRHGDAVASMVGLGRRHADVRHGHERGEPDARGGHRHVPAAPSCDRRSAMSRSVRWWACFSARS